MTDAMNADFSQFKEYGIKQIESDLSQLGHVYRVLLVEDNAGDARIVREMFKIHQDKLKLETVVDLATAIEIIRKIKFDIVLLDLSLPDSEGVDTLKRILSVSPELAVVVLTGLDDEVVGDELVQSGAQSYLVKGQIDENIIMRTLRHAYERQRLVSHLVTEISLRYELQQTLERNNKDLEKRIAQSTSELRLANRALSMLSQCNRAMLHAGSESELLQRVCELVSSTGGYPLAWIGLLDNTNRFFKLAACAGKNRKINSEVSAIWSSGINRYSLFRRALHGPYVVQDAAIAPGPPESWRYFLHKHKFSGMIILPMQVNNEPSGILTIYSHKHEIIDQQNIELLREMAADISFGLTAFRTEKERQLEQSKTRKFSTALQQTDDIVMIMDKNGLIEYVNPAFEYVTGYTSEDAIGHIPGKIIGCNSAEDVNKSDMWQQLKKGEIYRGTFVNNRKNGEVYYEQKTVTPIRNQDGEISYFLSTGKDITDDIQIQERLRKLLNYDSLTDLPNRNLFIDHLTQAYEQAAKKHKQLAVYIVNVDRFKNINSSLGHKVGDDVLRMVAGRLKEYFRPMDFVARLVGNTFAIIDSDNFDENDLLASTRDLLNYLSKPITIKEHEIILSATMGVAIAKKDCKNAQQLLRNAEAAMYSAKQRAPGQVEFYNKSINESSIKTLALETALLHALERNQFILHYQPKISLLTREVIGVEALLRWQHPQLGLVQPGEFIPLLEQTGLIVNIGQWVLEESCRQLQEWTVQRLDSLQISLNLSARQFLHKDLIRDFSAFLSGENLKLIKNRIELEITESSFMQDLQHGIEILQQLKELGFGIAIDDFGTGYSSLSYLSRLPADVLKIDRSFIMHIPRRSDDIEIVRAIIALAQTLNLKIVAEGVETREQHDFLLDTGCDMGQGYFYSRPVPSHEIPKFVSMSKCND